MSFNIILNDFKSKQTKDSRIETIESLFNETSLLKSSSTSQLIPTYDYCKTIDESRDVDNTIKPIELKENKVTEKWYKSLVGLALTILSALFFSITTVIVKHVKDVKSEQMAFIRFFGILVFCFPLLLDLNLNPFGPKTSRKFLIIRGIAGATSIFFRYSALNYMSISNATVIILSMPIFVFIFARVFLREPFGRFHIIALLVTLIGITFTSKLVLIFTHSKQKQKLLGIDFKQQLIGLSFGMGAALVGAAAYVLVRKFKEVNHSIILFNFSWVAIVETSIITLVMNDFRLPNNLQQLNDNAWLLVLLGVFSFYGQFLLTKALQTEEAGIVSITRASSEVIYSFIFQITIFKDFPDFWSYLGAFLVILSVIMTSFRKYLLSLPNECKTREKLYFLIK